MGFILIYLLIGLLSYIVYLSKILANEPQRLKGTSLFYILVVAVGFCVGWLPLLILCLMGTGSTKKEEDK